MSALETQMYVYQLPYEESRKLCFLLDKNNTYEELGKRMGFEEMDLQTVRNEVVKGRSPASKLLTMWGDFNHTIIELFVLLDAIGLQQGLLLLKPLVPEKYHQLIKLDNANNSPRLRVVNSKVPSNNFNKVVVKQLQKEVLLEETQDNNVTSEDTKNDNSEAPNVAVNVKHKATNNLQLPTQKDSTKALSDCVASNAGGTPQISYQELEIATENWNSKKILGQGGFGTVFRGTWKLTQVAIKRLEMKEQSRKDFTELIRQSVTELHCLNAYRHDNILPLYGYSIGGPHPCLVYQYMPGGSVDSRIRTRDLTKLLNWSGRLKVATGAARGLQFLHTTLHGNKPLIHGDIKCANILLDSNDEPRIGDFGLAREGPERHYTHIQVTRVHGTLPYLPQEFLRSKQFSTKIDTYSFGVVLFELATGKLPVDNKSLLRDLVVNFPEENLLQLKDPNVEGGEEVFSGLVEIGKGCVQKRAKDRPQMVEVLLMLENVGGQR